jgi:hypothetical protein
MKLKDANRSLNEVAVLVGINSDKPHGTTTHTQVTNACFAVGERPNKTHIFRQYLGHHFKHINFPSLPQIEQVTHSLHNSVSSFLWVTGF